MVIIEGIHRGHYVIGALGTGCAVAVPIRPENVASPSPSEIHGVHIGAEFPDDEDLVDEDDDQDLDDLDNEIDNAELEITPEIGADPEVAGFFKRLKRRIKKRARKIKRRFKRAGRRVKRAARKVRKKARRFAKKTRLDKAIRVAKKIAKNKITRSLYRAVKNAAPSPYKEYIAGAEAAIRFSGSLVKMAKGRKKGRGSKRARTRLVRMKSLINQLSSGKRSYRSTMAAAKRLRLPARRISAIAAFKQGVEKRNPAALAAAQAAKNITKAVEKPRPSKQKGRTFPVTGPSGQRYMVNVQRAA